MLLLQTTTDKLQVVTGSAVSTVYVHASFMDGSTANPPVISGSTSGRQNTAIMTATTTDIVAAPGASTMRNVVTLNIRNGSSSPTDVTVVYNQNGTTFELHKVNLAGGEALVYIDQMGWFEITTTTTRLDAQRRVSADWTNSTVTFSDVTGLQVPVQNGKQYVFLCHLFHFTAATTTGAQFGVNGPAATAMRVNSISTIAASATAATMAAGNATAVDTNVITETTGPATEVLGILSGHYNPSADGTFSIRGRSEVAASAVTVKAGSWLRLWETEN